MRKVLLCYFLINCEEEDSCNRHFDINYLELERILMYHRYHSRPRMRQHSKLQQHLTNPVVTCHHPPPNLSPLELNTEPEAKDQHKPTPTNRMGKKNVNELNETITGLLLLNANDHPDTIEEALTENANLMPVGEPPKLDLAKELDETIADNENKNTDTHSSEDTEPYLESDKNQDSDLNNEPKSPKGRLVTKKYGLKHKPTYQRKYTCSICGTVMQTAQI